MALHTIQDIERAGFLLRVWCLWCARGEVIKPGLWVRWVRAGRTIDLFEARQFFRCKVCRQTAHVLLLPASWPPTPPAKARPVEPERERTWADEVAAFFHSNRAAQKRERADRSADQIARAMIEYNRGWRK